MSLRRTPTGAAISGFDKDEPPSTSKAKSKSFFGEKTPSNMMRKMSLVMLSAVVVGVCYSTFVASSSGARPPTTTTHTNVRRRQTTDGADTQCT